MAEQEAKPRQYSTKIQDFISGNNTDTPVLWSELSVIVKEDLDLQNVDNTSDADKPISDATQTALNDIDVEAEFKKVQYVAPITGATVLHTLGNTLLIINPLGTLSTLTITLANGAYNGQLLNIFFSKIITTLTMNGATLFTNVPSAISGLKLSYRWSEDLSKWI